MKKIFTTIAMAAFAMTGFAQTAQQYFRVEFTMPIVSDGSGGGTSVASGMKDDYTYCNPEHQYLDFQAGGNIVTVGTNSPRDNSGKTGTAMPMGFRSTTNSPTETSAFYLHNERTAQYNTSQGRAEVAKYPYQVDRIKSITAYSIPVEKVSLIDSTATHEITFVGDGKKYKVSEFTFNRLPRNVAELKTLMENADGSRVAAAQNPMFIAAVMYLVWPRLLDCSRDCRDMIDYLYGAQYKSLNTYGISNQSFQNVCISHFNRDANGFYEHYQLFQFFDGATPANQYKPNGKGYGYDNGPYKVRVAWSNVAPTEYSAQSNATICNFLLMPNISGATKADISFEDPVPHVVKVRSTKNNGWFFYSNEKTYYAKGKDQRDDDF
jgi:hypothetical protein